MNNFWLNTLVKIKHEKAIVVLFFLLLYSSCYHKKDDKIINSVDDSITSLYKIADPHGIYNTSISKNEKKDISSFYSIIKKARGQTRIDNHKIEYSLRINTELSKDTLDLIADEIKSITSTDIPDVFISFYLPNMIVGAGSYALSKRTEYDNKTTINMIQSKNLPKTTPINDGRKIIGKWRMSMGTTFIYQKIIHTIWKINIVMGLAEQKDLKLLLDMVERDILMQKKEQSSM